MEITTKERYFYISTFPLIIACLLFLVIKYAPWKNPKKICEEEITKIISKKMGGNFEDFTFKIGEPIKLSLESKGDIKKYNWDFDELQDSLIFGGVEEEANIVFYKEIGEPTVEIFLNEACHVSKKLVIINNCDDGIQNGDETTVDCGGSCGICGSDEKEKKSKPQPKRDRYEIKVSERDLKCDTTYRFTCINKTRNKNETEITWIFDQVDTPIYGNPKEMAFRSEQTYVNHRIAAFKMGKLLATKTITIKCDKI